MAPKNFLTFLCSKIYLKNLVIMCPLRYLESSFFEGKRGSEIRGFRLFVNFKFTLRRYLGSSMENFLILGRYGNLASIKTLIEIKNHAQLNVVAETKNPAVMRDVGIVPYLRLKSQVYTVRPGGDSNPCMAVLQTAALPLRHLVVWSILSYLTFKTKLGGQFRLVINFLR